MKITIDTNAKTIKVEDQVNFAELQDELDKLLGESSKEYTLLQSGLNIVYVPIQRWEQPYPYWSVQPYFNQLPVMVNTCMVTGYATTNLISYGNTTN